MEHTGSPLFVLLNHFCGVLCLFLFIWPLYCLSFFDAASDYLPFDSVLSELRRRYQSVFTRRDGINLLTVLERCFEDLDWICAHYILIHLVCSDFSYLFSSFNLSICWRTHFDIGSDSSTHSPQSCPGQCDSMCRLNLGNCHVIIVNMNATDRGQTNLYGLDRYLSRYAV